MLKKLLSALLCLILSFSLIQPQKMLAAAAETDDQNYTYENKFDDSGDKTKSDPMLYFICPDNFNFENGMITQDGNSWATISSSCLLGGTPYKVWASLSAAGIGNSKANAAACIGVRTAKGAS
ncbi:MAG: hypothetical protein LBI03_02260, partial [Clostridiales bacterium]|nr:hypothetical protein [Clostridiales bacterium]